MRAEKTDTNIRQEQIAEAALMLVAADGMKGLSVARIARHVGVVPSALYRHYKNKDKVLDAVLGLIQDRLMANIQTVQQETKDPLKQLYKLLMKHIKLIRENQGIPRIVFSEDVYSGHQGRKQQVYAIINGYLSKIEAIISEGQKSGAIRKELDPESIALIFFGLVQPSAILWHLSSGDFDITKEARKSWAIIEKAIKDEMHNKTMKSA